jgi:excisionase family DNA binding protein
MKKDHLRRRKRGDDRRKKADRRNGADRRALNHLKVFTGEADQDVVFTTKQACEYLKISRPTYLKYIATGRIKAIKIGRGWRILKVELDRFLRGE